MSGRVVPGLPEEAAPRPTAQARLAEHSFLLLYLSRHTWGISWVLARVFSRRKQTKRQLRAQVLSLSHVWDAHKRAVLHCLAPLFLGGLSASFCLNPAIIPSYRKRGQGRARITVNGGMGDPCICILETMAGGTRKNKDLERKANDNCTLDRVDPHRKTREGFTVCLEMNRCRAFGLPHALCTDWIRN